jgi:hypothetical protein
MDCYVRKLPHNDTGGCGCHLWESEPPGEPEVHFQRYLTYPARQELRPPNALSSQRGEAQR